MKKKTKVIGVVIGILLLVGVMAGLYLHFGQDTGREQDSHN